VVSVSITTIRGPYAAVPPLRRPSGGCSIDRSSIDRRASTRSVNISRTELHQRWQRRLAWLCVGAMVLVAGACGNTADSVTERAVTQLVAVGPVQATVAAGTLFPDPPKVLVLDQYGAPFPGISVIFAVTAGGGVVTGTDAGYVTSTAVATNLAGVSSVLWQTGAAPGTNTLTARVGNVAPVVFTATATAAP
jgi:hypothetical protein